MKATSAMYQTTAMDWSLCLVLLLTALTCVVRGQGKTYIGYFLWHFRSPDLWPGSEHLFFRAIAGCHLLTILHIFNFILKINRHQMVIMIIRSPLVLKCSTWFYFTTNVNCVIRYDSNCACVLTCLDCLPIITSPCFASRKDLFTSPFTNQGIKSD